MWEKDNVIKKLKLSKGSRIITINCIICVHVTLVPIFFINILNVCWHFSKIRVCLNCVPPSLLSHQPAAAVWTAPQLPPHWPAGTPTAWAWRTPAAPGRPAEPDTHKQIQVTTDSRDKCVVYSESVICWMLKCACNLTLTLTQVPTLKNTQTHIDVPFILNERWYSSLSMFPISHLTAEVPQGSVQEPRWFQIRRVNQVVTTLRMEVNPLTVHR